MKLFEKESLLIVILVLFSASLFVTGLSAMPLTDPDEVFYAETAREMLARGQVLTPYIFGNPQFEKPPLYYWFVMLGFKIFGINEFSARIASGIFGIFGVVGIYLLGKILINKRAGFFAGIMLATSIKYLALSRACVTDILLCVLILYAFLFFFYAYLSESGKLKRYLLSSVFLALAVLTKGPIGIFLPVVIIGIYLIFVKELKKLKEIPVLRGAMLFLAVALPWYLLMYKVHGKEFIDVFFGFHNIVRFLKPEHRLGDVFYYYVPILIGGFSPWAAFLPLGIWQAFREKNEKLKKTNIFLISWFLVIFVFFSFSRTKLPTYIFPLYPALALLTGRLFDVFLDKGFTGKQEKAMNISLYLFLALPIGGLIGLCIVANKKYPAAITPLFIAGIAFVLAMAFFVTALLKRKYTKGIIFYMMSFAIFMFPLSYIILPEIGKYESSKHVSKKLLEFAKPGEELGAETRYRRGVAFYMKKEDVLDVHRHHIITEFLLRKQRVWCVVKDKNHIQLYTDSTKGYDNPTYVMYKIGKKVIVTNKVSPGEKFLKLRSINDPY
ncbi:MAG: glycosyltransferase family 39 protein [Candidatus Omnitrophota bacterium]|nr:MAG: glycosyltransferase family 39 protein [Candidatus Omnitrophota bacterium]